MRGRGRWGRQVVAGSWLPPRQGFRVPGLFMRLQGEAVGAKVGP